MSNNSDNTEQFPESEEVFTLEEGPDIAQSEQVVEDTKATRKSKKRNYRPSTETVKQDTKETKKVRVFNRSNNNIQISVDRHTAYWLSAKSEVLVDEADIEHPKFKAYSSELIIRR